jgi:hypothetical protein
MTQLPLSSLGFSSEGRSTTYFAHHDALYVGIVLPSWYIMPIESGK